MHEDPQVEAFCEGMMKSNDRLPDLELARQQEAEFKNKNRSNSLQPQKLHYVIPKKKIHSKKAESKILETATLTNLYQTLDP